MCPVLSLVLWSGTISIVKRLLGIVVCERSIAKGAQVLLFESMRVGEVNVRRMRRGR